MAKRDSDRDPGYGATTYGGGVFGSEAYGSGAEDYDITGERSNAGKGPKKYKGSDARIHDEICERLKRHPLIDAGLIDVRIENGNVTLSGEVRDRHAKQMAEDAVNE